MIQTERKYISCRTVFDCQIRPANQKIPSELIILLHGYAETGSKITESLLACLPEQAIILAPNGPYPLPFRKSRAFEVSHAWYFYDSKSREYFIDPSIGVDFIKNGINTLKLENLPKRIIGFSQGGYLAPLAALALTQVRQVIGIGCEYLFDEFPTRPTFRIDAIHGEKDLVVDIEDARKTHAVLLDNHIKGEFRLIPELGHLIDSTVSTVVRELLQL